MAKGLRSNNKKALRTVRRKKLAENPEWHAKAEANRQEVMARVLATDKPPAQEQSGAAGMDVEAPQATAAAAAAPADGAEKQGGGEAKMVTSTGKIHLTKKKSMKLKKNKQQAGNDLWKQGSAMSFHNKRKKKASA